MGRPAGRGSVVLTAALAEEDGDDPRAPSATAVRKAGGWVLSGTKTLVPVAPRADLLLVPAAGPDAVMVFGVSPSDDGVTVEPQRLTDFAEAGRVVLDSVALDDDRVLGPGAPVADWLVSRGTVGLCATQAGVIERALELTAEYARNRVQFGRPIGSFQAVTQRLADAYIDAEAGPADDGGGRLAAGPRATPGPVPRWPRPSSGPPTRATGWRTPRSTCTAGWASTRPTRCTATSWRPSHHEFALGGATAQLRRIGMPWPAKPAP